MNSVVRQAFGGHNIINQVGNFNPNPTALGWVGGSSHDLPPLDAFMSFIVIGTEYKWAVVLAQHMTLKPQANVIKLAPTSK